MIHFLLACQNPTSKTTENDLSSQIVDGEVRFIAIGDAGEGNDNQYAVSDIVAEVCEAQGCDFALYLGDNFYDVGVESVEDVQFQEKFENPYANLDFPFYVVLGNHDYGGAGHLIDKPEPQVAYSDLSEKWVLPDRYYDFSAEHIQFLGLDTNALMWSSQWGGHEEQANWAGNILLDSNRLWNIAFGHHPYISNGSHGVAGEYDGLVGVPIASGGDVKRFVEEQLCGKVDVYFSGHDHDLQWLEPQCGTEFIVSGAGAKNRSMTGWDVPTYFETDQQPGFVWVEIVDRRMSVQFYGMDGTILYESEINK
jgi:hypothetical protein